MQSLKGHLLIATPQLSAPLFARSVILMLDHSDEGAMGVILNQPTNTPLTALAGKVFSEEFVWDKPIHLGGPVPGSLMVVHADEDIQGRAVIPGVFTVTDPEMVQEVISMRPEPSLVIANYSGWGPGQLEGEFNRDSWLTVPATAKHVFWTDEMDLWKSVVNEVNARKLSEFLNLREIPSDPTLN